MFDFATTMKDWRRMCAAQEQIDDNDPCRLCPLDNNGEECCSIYEESNNINYEHIARIVRDWAAEHPPVEYPTWTTWLNRHNMSIYDPIPAKIAEKLNIEPQVLR